MKWKLVGVVLVCFLCMGTGNGSAAELKVGGPGKTAYRTLQDAVKAAKTGDIIVLEEGLYMSPGMISIKGKEKLTIMGKGKVELICSDPDAHVVELEDCKNIILRNIKSRHDPVQKNVICGGNVFSIKTSQDISVEGCELNGCGAVGIRSYQSKGIVVKDSFIHHNSNVGIWLISSENVEITQTKIANNLTGVHAVWSNGVSIRQCEFLQNSSDLERHDTENWDYAGNTTDH